MAASVEIPARVAMADRAVPQGADAADAAPFSALVERQARVMFRVAMAVLRTTEDAEDAVQEAFLRLTRGGGWQEAREERAYGARVVWRVAVDRAAARGVRAEQPLTDREGTEMELAAAGDSAEQQMAESGERARLQRLIDGLPEELRQPLVLCAIEEMGSREVGAAMGCPRVRYGGASCGRRKSCVNDGWRWKGDGDDRRGDAF